MLHRCCGCYPCLRSVLSVRCLVPPPVARLHSLPLLACGGRHPCPIRHVPSCLASSSSLSIMYLPSAVLMSSFNIRVLHISSCASWFLLLRVGILCILVCTPLHDVLVPHLKRHHKKWSCLRPVDRFVVNWVRGDLQFELRPRWRFFHAHHRFCIRSFVSGWNVHALSYLPPHVEFVHLVVLHHGLERCLPPELGHFSVCGRPACLLHRRLAISPTEHDGCRMVHHERHHWGVRFLYLLDVGLQPSVISGRRAASSL